MLTVTHSTRFKKDIKKIERSNADLTPTKDIITKLSNGVDLDAKYKDHPLQGKYKGYRECHARPDLLLIYKRNQSELHLHRLGSHSELFEDLIYEVCGFML